LPWTPTSAVARKGIAWKPSVQANLDPATSDVLLTAIARARSWMNDLVEGRVNSFEEIARTENKVERPSVSPKRSRLRSIVWDQAAALGRLLR
jgi:hypothetical protein